MQAAKPAVNGIEKVAVVLRKISQDMFISHAVQKQCLMYFVLNPTAG